MVIVNRGSIPVACYDDVTQKEALLSFVEEEAPRPKLSDIIMDNMGNARLIWHGQVYDAKAYHEDF